MTSSARRWLVLTLAVLGIGIVGILYQGWIARVVQQQGPGQSVPLFSLGPDTADGVTVHATVVGIDPNRAEMQVRLDFAPGGSYLDERGALSRPLLLSLKTTRGSSEYRFARGSFMAPLDFSTPLRGSPFYYPSDLYTSLVEISLRSSNSEDTSVTLKAYSRMAGFSAARAELESEFPSSSKGLENQRPGQFVFQIEAQRAPLVKIFARLILGLHWLLTVVGLAVTLAVLVAGRRADPVLWVWLTGLLFALPLTRSMMVGAPEIGIYLDFFGFLICEVTVALCLAILVSTWLLRKNR